MGSHRQHNQAASALRHYWDEANRPLVSLVFVAPLLAVYEFGLIWLGPEAMRNGADAWLRSALHHAGLTQYFLLPVLTCGILLGWHHIRREPWRVRGSILYGMAVESLALGVLLVAVAHGIAAAMASIDAAGTLAMGSVDQLVAFLGAGIYEELLFRLMLLPALFAALTVAGIPARTSLFAAVAATSCLFAAAHYRFDVALGPFEWTTAVGDPFTWTSFLFRVTAGAFFSLLFWYRGFGIAVGAHALYDILVGWC